ncbi:hypothetical protein [Frankia sp. AiPa1]|uniref:hypothetical protein n=1 Tax=Frankia sp. AiPa1 TaxID=573492 RepID=UPI0035A86E7A
MHTVIRRTCYVLLFGLVLEGALTFPLLAVWYGFPKLSLTQVCSELQKVTYSDEARKCDVPYSFPGPPLAGPAEAQGQHTSRDVTGIQPKPLYDKVEFREFVKHYQICQQFEGRPDKELRNLSPQQQQFREYCAYIADRK